MNDFERSVFKAVEGFANRNGARFVSDEFQRQELTFEARSERWKLKAKTYYDEATIDFMIVGASEYGNNHRTRFEILEGCDPAIGDFLKQVQKEVDKLNENTKNQTPRVLPMGIDPEFCAILSKIWNTPIPSNVVAEIKATPGKVYPTIEFTGIGGRVMVFFSRAYRKGISTVFWSFPAEGSLLGREIKEADCVEDVQGVFQQAIENINAPKLTIEAALDQLIEIQSILDGDNVATAADRASYIDKQQRLRSMIVNAFNGLEARG